MFREPTHCVPEAIIFVDVSCAGAQFDAVAQTHSSPLSQVELTSWDAVHLARLAAFVNHILLTEPQPPVILQQIEDIQAHTSTHKTLVKICWDLMAKARICLLWSWKEAN